MWGWAFPSSITQFHEGNTLPPPRHGNTRPCDISKEHQKAQLITHCLNNDLITRMGMRARAARPPARPPVRKERKSERRLIFGPGKGRGTGGGERRRAEQSNSVSCVPPSPIRLLLTLAKGRGLGGARVCSTGVETLGFCCI